MKSKRIQIIWLAVCILLLVMIGMFQPKEVNWTPTFSANDKIPYGNFVLYKEIEKLFPDNGIYKNTKPFYNFYDEDASGNFVIISTEAKADKLDVEAMTEFVRNGNTIFIAATDIAPGLQDSLGIQFNEDLNVRGFAGDTAPYQMNFTNPQLKAQKPYGFKRSYMSQSIADADSVRRRFVLGDSTIRTVNRLPRIALGTDKHGKVNFAKIPFGEGNFFIHTFPFAFTNYNMLKGNGHDYIAKCFSYLPDAPVYWDEYYKPYAQQKPTTPLRFILSVSAYKWAYYCALISMLVYILFSIKREQRIIPIIEPFKNLSLEFARTVGSLYYQQSDHKNLADKKMVYFLEKIRNTYHLSTAIADEPFKERLAHKSNVSKETIEEVFSIYNSSIRGKYSVDEQALIKLNAALEKFYNESGLTNK